MIFESEQSEASVESKKLLHASFGSEPAMDLTVCAPGSMFIVYTSPGMHVEQERVPVVDGIEIRTIKENMNGDVACYLFLLEKSQYPAIAYMVRPEEGKPERIIINGASAGVLAKNTMICGSELEVTDPSKIMPNPNDPENGKPWPVKYLIPKIEGISVYNEVGEPALHIGTVHSELEQQVMETANILFNPIQSFLEKVGDLSKNELIAFDTSTLEAWQKPFFYNRVDMVLDSCYFDTSTQEKRKHNEAFRKAADFLETDPIHKRIRLIFDLD
jgi:hypothetical protein